MEAPNQLGELINVRPGDLWKCYIATLSISGFLLKGI